MAPRRVAQTAAGREDPRVDKPAEDAVVGCFGAALSDEGVARSANRFYDYGFLTRVVQGRRQMATLVSNQLPFANTASGPVRL